MEEGFLERPGGHTIFWRASGAPEGKPVLIIHGGPGAGSDPSLCRLFDLSNTRVVQIDQRGAGRSIPRGELEGNDTSALIGDMEAVRRRLDIDRWSLFAGSWGTTLALLYAGEFADRCNSLILRGVTEWTRDKFDWALDHRRFLAPEAHRYLTEILSEGERGRIIPAYHHRILSGDDEAARRCYLYEQYFLKPVAGRPVGDTSALPADFRERARLHIHYWMNEGFVGDGRLDRAVANIPRIPIWIVHGSLDFVCPPLFAHKLAENLPWANVRIVPGAAHSLADPLIEQAVVAALTEAGLRSGLDL